MMKEGKIENGMSKAQRESEAMIVVGGGKKKKNKGKDKTSKASGFEE